MRGRRKNLEHIRSGSRRKIRRFEPGGWIPDTMCGPSKFQKFNVIRVCFWSKKGERVNRLGCVKIALVGLGLLAGTASPAQQSPHAGHSNAGPVPLEILQR